MGSREVAGRGRVAALGSFSLERLNKPADIRLHLDLIEFQRLDFFRLVSNRWQPVPFHVTAMMIVIVNKLGNEIIQMPLAEKYELRERFHFMV